MRKNILVLIVVALTFCFKSNAQDSIKNFVGTWEYTCEDAPYEYRTGSIVIETQNNEAKIKVVYQDGSQVKAESLSVKDGVLHFSVIVENETIPVELKRDNEKLIGKTYNEYGEEMKLTAKKKK